MFVQVNENFHIHNTVVYYYSYIFLLQEDQFRVILYGVPLDLLVKRGVKIDVAIIL